MNISKRDSEGGTQGGRIRGGGIDTWIKRDRQIDRQIVGVI